MNVRIIRDIKPSDVIVDPENVRGHYDVEGLAKEISQYSLIHPPTVVPDKLGKYHVLDGNRRIVACQKLEAGYSIKEAGKTVTYSLPSNFRVQVYEDELWEDLNYRKKIAIRVSATDSAEILTLISLGTALLEWVESYAKERFFMDYEVARKNRVVWRKIEDALLSEFPSKSIGQVRRALNVVTKFGSLSVREKIHESLKDGLLTEGTAASLSRVPEKDQDLAIKLTLEAKMEGATSEQIQKALADTRAELSKVEKNIDVVLREKLSERHTYKRFSITGFPRWLHSAIKYTALQRGVTISNLIVPVLSKEYGKYREVFERKKV